ncbi:protein phosphatase methylesterase 1-like isoform X2 [Paramacrobiotus metropolitanus]|uniref:protein phosphatase methylesterase 1-like isoform X2 n=1 Tax=Paramacrobiotus metropolitanus TaxID=2943436 RepID=UPI002445B303|nr:protein phosphatase methylesterase 1-like isoform X2 [Paramacrobiotus metropolitanus]
MDRQQILKNAAFVGLPSPVSSTHHQIPQQSARGRVRFTPASWDKYFDTKRIVNVKENAFSIFEKGSLGPVLYLIHGGGFSALSWALVSKAITELVACRCVAVDLRGHGADNVENAVVNSDIADVIRTIFPNEQDSPPIVLIGHSLGGAVCVHAASRNLIPKLVGLVVIDVVEGTALESLACMESIVRGRPKCFPSIENAIEWAFRSGHIKNPESACVSMIGQLMPMDSSSVGDSTDVCQAVSACDTIMEDGAPPETDTPKESTKTLIWRIDLLKTQPFWLGWFTGLSKMYLECPTPKLLLLAGMDRLDKDLTIGQMQGKFQMVVLPKSGHAVQEDQPVKVAEALATFLVRNKIVEAASEFQRTFPCC